MKAADVVLVTTTRGRAGVNQQGVATRQGSRSHASVVRVVFFLLPAARAQMSFYRLQQQWTVDGGQWVWFGAAASA